MLMYKIKISLRQGHTMVLTNTPLLVIKIWFMVKG